MKRIAPFLLIAVLAAGAFFSQRGGAMGNSLSGDLLVSLLGGFRGIAAEVVWFKADRLQAEGRFAEMAQLSAILTHLEPQTPEVWAYAAWNLSYNIAVSVTRPEDRWRWVDAGLRLLRDDGLRINPDEPTLYYELSLLYLMKIGGKLDEAAPYYRERWGKTVADVAGRSAWGELAMDMNRMSRLETVFGKIDWKQADASALYWATRGLECARTKKEVARFHQVVEISLKRLGLAMPSVS